MHRFIHTADWQLGKPFGRMPEDVRALLREARLDVIETIGAVAREQGADHVLVAGDVFDNAEPGDRVIRQALARMRDTACTWWLLPGNHDYARSEGLWSRLQNEAPANVRTLTEPVPVEMSDGVWILPAPLAYRRTTNDPTAVLSDMVTPAGATRIGLAHGAIQSFGSDHTTNLIAPDRARHAGLDYLALGDWHGFNQFGDRSAYSGTPEPDAFGRETTGGVVSVEAGQGAVPSLEFIRTARYRWLEAVWDVDGTAALQRELLAFRAGGETSRTLLKLAIHGIVSLAERIEIVDALANDLAHEVRYLDVDLSPLAARPTEDDLRDIDAQGALAVAAERLKQLAATGGSDATAAAMALERLYVETMRATRQDVAA